MKNVLFLLLLLPLLAQGQLRNVEAQFPIDEPSMANLHDGILGKWRFAEDSDKNNFYEIKRGGNYATDKYRIFFWDRGGTNASYESDLHFSKVANAQFINVPYLGKEAGHRGFFFLKILDVNADYSKITAALVNDKTLWDLTQAQVKQRITENVNNPKYYSDTVHLYKLH